MTVYENIAFVLRVIDAPPKFIKKRVPYVISLVGLDSRKDSYPDELSGGEKQRVAIARALVNDPQLIIADEPTGNIDPELSYEIVELLKGINDQGTTILMVTHEHELVRHFGGRIISITDGEIVFDEVVTGINDELLKEEMLAAANAQNQQSQPQPPVQPQIPQPQETEPADEIPQYSSTEDALVRSFMDRIDEDNEETAEINIQPAENHTDSADNVIAEITGGMQADDIIAKITADSQEGTLSEQIMSSEKIIDPKQTVEEIMKEIAENPEVQPLPENITENENRKDENTGGKV